MSGLKFKLPVVSLRTSTLFRLWGPSVTVCSRTRGRMIYKTRPSLCPCGVHSLVGEADSNQMATQTDGHVFLEPMIGFDLIREVRRFSVKWIREVTYGGCMGTAEGKMGRTNRGRASTKTVCECPFPFISLASYSSPIPCFSSIPLPHSQAVFPPTQSSPGESPKHPCILLVRPFSPFIQPFLGSYFHLFLHFICV